MWRKLLFFGLLYFIQGAALAYIINFQKPYLADSGVSKEAIGLFTSLLMIPFISKIFLGYISDRFKIGKWGSRKPYMVIGLSIFTLAFLAMSQVNPAENFKLFAICVWFASLGLAWFDTCADGWAVDVTEESRQSSVQAAMVGGKASGMILMAGLFGLMAQNWGFSSVFITIAGLAAIVLGIVLFVPYPGATSSNDVLVSNWRDIFKGFFIFLCLFALVCAFSSAGNDGLVTFHYKEMFNADSLQVGVFGVWRGLGALLGAAAFALVRPRFSMFKAHASACVVLGFGCLLSLLHLEPHLAAILWGVAWGYQETSFVTLAMRFAQGRWAATIFAGAMIFANIGVAIGEGIGAPSVPRIGWEGVFLLYAIVGWCSLAVLALTFYQMKKAGHPAS